jgi:hypothetical protein
MQGENESKTHLRIERLEVAAELMDMSKQKMLAPFFSEATTVTKAALQAGVKDLQMFRQVKRFEELGILHVTQTEKRQGRAIKYYQTTAREFFIPAQVFPLEQTLEHVEHTLQKIYLTNLAKTIYQHEPASDLGTSIALSRTGTGIVAVQLATAPGKLWNAEEMNHAAIIEFWLITQLNLEEAKALQKELADITERYAKKDGAQKYLLRLGLTPVE